MPVIVARIISLLGAPRTGRPFRTGFCAKSALPGAVVIRNGTASPRRRSGKSRRPVSKGFRPERAKEDTAGEAQLTYSCRRARLCALPARCSTFAVSERIFGRPSFPRVLRSGFSDSRGWIPLGLAYPFPFSIRTSIRETAHTLERKALSRAAPPTPCRPFLYPLPTTEKMPPVETFATVSGSLR